MIILHFDLQPQFNYMNYFYIWIIFIYTLHQNWLDYQSLFGKRTSASGLDSRDQQKSSRETEIRAFLLFFFVWLLKILWQLRMMAFPNEHPEWDQNPWFILLTDSSETKSILDFSICLSLSPPGKTVCYRKRRIHDERASQFFSALQSIFLLLKPEIVEVCKSI